ncbi:Xaa-Pro peptidase family protein [Sinobaca sp. H24]|uniref:M24 family metallopeptidase n=1 Tax=Sinobaca sp. H24 TaxID=2923376 RepID=UPI0020797E6E|nr:Xaa-Pro peptidase family protein [Sinobaca sp. H24]
MQKLIQQIRAQLENKEIEAIFIESPTNRRYLSGFTGTAGALFITKEQAYFITDFRYIEQAAEECPEFEIVKHEKGIISETARLTELLSLKAVGFEEEYVTYQQYTQMKKQIHAELVPTSSIVEHVRLYKTPEEIAVLKEAAAIADRAFDHITTFIKPGMKETEVSNELEFFMRREGAVSSSFDIIVASGWRSALPHGVASSKIIEGGELVTLDYGAYYKGYCSDITRTIAVGEPTSELKKIYQTVLEAQLLAVEQIKPGMTGIEADQIARAHIEQAGYGKYFGHGLGHGLGMEVHEGPRLSPKGSQVLEPGMVVTVEPGIYVPKAGGTRIEDDIVITEEGNEVLTYAPKELVIVGE